MDRISAFEKKKNAPKEEEPHEDASEIFVHQLIETIQFALGAVSNTASYLRLWALSLAHSQLANVFFDKTLKNSLEINSIVGAGIGNVNKYLFRLLDSGYFVGLLLVS